MKGTGTPRPNRARWNAFWARRLSDRPLLTAWVGSYDVSQLYPTGLGRLQEGTLLPAHLAAELFAEDYERLYEAHCGTGSDVPWAAFPVMVMPWVEAICGCRLHHSGGHVWAEPWLNDYARLNTTGWMVGEDWLEALLAFQRGLIRLSDGRFPVALSLMRGPTDVLAAMRGAQQLIYDYYDRPDDVRVALLRLADTWVQIAHAQCRQLVPFAGGYSFSVQTLWASEPGGWFQDDALAYSSPSFFRQFSLEPARRLAGCMARTGMHLHAPALYAVDDLVQIPELDVIEVNVDDVGPRLPEMLPRLKQIIARKRLFIWGALTDHDLQLIRQELPCRGLALQLIAATSEAAAERIARAKAIWR